MLGRLLGRLEQLQHHHRKVERRGVSVLQATSIDS